MKISSISVIDDDPVNLLLLKETLKDYFLVQAYRDPFHFLDNLSRTETRLVITDLMMPGMDGFALIRRIRQLKPGLPIIIISAKDEPDTIRKAYQLGVEAYYRKPLNLTTFSDKLLDQINHNV